MTRGYVYFILAGDLAAGVRCKIGFTRGNPASRLRDLQCGSPLKLQLYAYTEGSKEAESIFHDTFAPLRLHGEWFKVEGKLQDFLFYLIEDAAGSGVVTGETLMTAVFDVILAEEVPHPSVDRDAYLSSVDTRHWERLREPLNEAIEAGTW